ncbi:AsnC family transcriptional regulator [Photobacterium aquae]|uniref:Leucine-responsive regulatory protein n=1 Tax=Photobacterium aquae TaxID=1195763 RepID=A0A0J1GZQ3_9GAMM|nr:Lrp/AsnC family transcriptional regulator [Photobacterium aquae]KLV05121.1 AsnC family transcriptional regulator [Photobacterium aquae]
MDRFDERILCELKSNGKLTNVELADRVGLSPSATLRRVQELERQNVLVGYRAVLNKQKIGIGFIAYVAVGLSNHSRKSQQEFEIAISAAQAVVECHNITGTSEYLLRVETHDLPAYKRFHAEILGESPHVSSITTMVVMDSVKDERG